MVKTLDLGGGRELTLTNDISWMMEYRDQFGQDIVPVLMPILLGITQTMGALVEEVGDMKKLNTKAFFRVMGSEAMMDIALKLSTFEIVDVLNITWAMAKAADESIPEPKKWIKGLGGEDHEETPLADVIIPAVVDLAIRGVMRPKNWERLTENLSSIKESLQPQKEKTTKKPR